MAGEGRWRQVGTTKAARHQVFALQDSGLQAFLYADVGTEPNGFPLTILSMLARLGHDPWTQAASWAAMPRAAAIDGLSQSIVQMPLVPAALAGSRDIAARLVQLLPLNTRHASPVERGGAAPAGLTGRPAMMIWCGIAAGIGLSLMLTLKLATDDLRPQRPPMAFAGSVATVAAPSLDHAAPAASAVPIQP